MKPRLRWARGLWYCAFIGKQGWVVGHIGYGYTPTGAFKDWQEWNAVHSV